MIRIYTDVTGEVLTGNSDIVLELKAGSTIIGRWKFSNAITEGHMNQPAPLRLSVSRKEQITN